MFRERFHENPLAGRFVLVVGAIAHFLLCLPLYGRRGAPEVDPFWLSMQWLWVPPVIISAVYSQWSKRRAKDLLVYAFAAGFVVSWSTVLTRPGSRTASAALVELIVFWPMLLVGVGGVELASRAVLHRLRQFIPETASCEECSYCLYGLTEPRCPECGTAFPIELLDPNHKPPPTPLIRRWTMLLLIVVCAGTLAFPGAYRLWRFHSLDILGEELAEEEWAAGKARWFVKRDELEAMTLEQLDRFYELYFRKDPATGLEIEPMRERWESRWQSSYRKVIEHKLSESGLSAPFDEPP